MFVSVTKQHIPRSESSHLNKGPRISYRLYYRQTFLVNVQANKNYTTKMKFLDLTYLSFTEPLAGIT